MITIPFLLQVVALVLLFMASFNLAPNSKVTWGWLGMFFWLLSLMLSAVVLHQAH